MAKKKVVAAVKVAELDTLVEENALLAKANEEEPIGMSLVPFGGLLNKYQLDTLTAKTPDKYIYKREGRGGKQLDYVSIGYVVHVLNKVFNTNGWRWSYDLEEVSNMEMVGKTGNIVVKGTLTIMSMNGDSRSIKQYGSAEVKLHSRGDRVGRPVDIGDDYKAAGSDALKKCASLIGVANDIYFKDWGNFQDVREDAEPEVKIDPPTPVMAEAVDDATTQARRRIFERVKVMFDGDKAKMVEFIETATGVKSFMALSTSDLALLDSIILEPGEVK